MANVLKKTLTLQAESGNFVDKQSGNAIDYVTLFVVVNGLKIKVAPADGTAKQILHGFFKAE